MGSNRFFSNGIRKPVLVFDRKQALFIHVSDCTRTSLRPCRPFNEWKLYVWFISPDDRFRFGTYLSLKESRTPGEKNTKSSPFVNGSTLHGLLENKCKQTRCVCEHLGSSAQKNVFYIVSCLVNPSFSMHQLRAITATRYWPFAVSASNIRAGELQTCLGISETGSSIYIYIYLPMETPDFAEHFRGACLVGVELRRLRCS